MNHQHDDEFLTQFRRLPHPRFTDDLTARLAQIETEPPARNAHLPMWPAAVRLTRRRILIGGAMAGVATIALGAALLLIGDSGTVSAQEVLGRAQAAATANYHLRALTHKADGSTQEIETWQRGDGSTRTEIVVKNAAGAVEFTFGRVVNPTRFWGFYTQNGETHYGTQAVTADGQPPTKPQAPQNVAQQSTIDAVLGNLQQCGDPRRLPDATVAGRPVYVIALGQSGCNGDASKPGAPAVQPEQMTLWLDKESFVLLRSEGRDTAGRVTNRYEVTSIEFNVTLLDSMFIYTPPPGAIEDSSNPSKP